MVALHGDGDIRFRQEGLLLGLGLGFPELALLDGGLLLAGVSLHLFFRDLAAAELDEDLLDLAALLTARRRADEDFLEFQVVLLELRLHLHAALVLDRGAVLEELDERAGLAHIFEVGAHHRVEGLFHEALDVPEALDDQRSLLVVNVHDDGEGRLGSKASFVMRLTSVRFSS